MVRTVDSGAVSLLNVTRLGQAEVARLMDRRSLGLFPWENFGASDNNVPLAWWQKLYWVAFGCAVTRWQASSERFHDSLHCPKADKALRSVCFLR